MTALLSTLNVQPPRTRGRPRTEDLPALEGRIISASGDLFFRQGYGSTTMSDVARAAMVSKTTLYARFSSKADLFRAIVAAQAKSWKAIVSNTPVEDCETAEQALLVYGEVALRVATSPAYVQMNRLIYSESWRFPELGEAADARFKMGVAGLKRRFLVFAERGQVPRKDPLPALELFQLMLMGRSSGMILSNRPIIEEEQEAWLAMVVRTILRSLSSG